MQKTKKVISKILIAVFLLPAICILPLTADATTPGYEIDYESRVSDPDTSGSSFMGFLDIPWLHDGRIWADKSVNVRMAAGANDFDVTLSALSQSFMISDAYVVPADTVFIIDVSGSMYQESINGRPRVAVLVDALNEAIGILLDANPENRVAVVAYGGGAPGTGDSRGVEIIPLGRPVLTTDATSFFSHRVSGSNHYIDVNTTNRQIASVIVQGSTPTQWGILLGANVLTSATDRTIPALNPAGDPVIVGGIPQTVTRKPNIILMTDGEPTMAWNDYLFATDPTSTSQDYGDGSYGETGVSLLTILTAAHRKRLVSLYYYANNPAHPGALNGIGPGTVGFYTISLNDDPPPPLISATMFPFNPSNTAAPGYADAALPTEVNIDTLGGDYPYPDPPGTGLNISMGTLLRNFAATPATPITFAAQWRNPTSYVHGTYVWRPDVQATNSLTTPLTLTEIAYADKFFPANDLQTLRDAFAEITTDIQRDSYSAVTAVPPGADAFGGYLVFSDVLGEYMEFRGVTGFEFDGTLYNRAGFAPAIIGNISSARDRYEDILYHHLNYGNLDIFGVPIDSSRFVDAATVTALITANIESGYTAANNSIKYYAKANRDFAGSFYNLDGTLASIPSGAVATVEVYPMWGDIGTPVLPGGETNLMHITFHVVTVLNNNTVFKEIFSVDPATTAFDRTLNRGDQIIRWYIPASFIPQRHLAHSTGVLSGNEQPTRVHYRVGLNETLIRAGISSAYTDKHTVGNQLYFYTNRNPDNVTLAIYQPHILNPFYQPGRPGYDDIRGVLKSSNRTRTAPLVSRGRVFGSLVGERTNIIQLGNNGRLTITFEVPPVPPTPPPSPQTGITQSVAPYIAVVIGILLAGSGFVFIIRDKLFFRRKND